MLTAIFFFGKIARIREIEFKNLVSKECCWVVIVVSGSFFCLFYFVSMKARCVRGQL